MESLGWRVDGAGGGRMPLRRLRHLEQAAEEHFGGEIEFRDGLALLADGTPQQWVRIGGEWHHIAETEDGRCLFDRVEVA